MKVVAVIGDIVESKKISNRSIFQEDLSNHFKKLNKKSKNEILSPYTITLGDEFQVIYNNLDKIFPDVWSILEHVYPQKVRFSIGLDTLSTRINPNKAIGMDGPAFHIAREGINNLKKYSSSIIQLYKTKSETINLINKSLALVFHSSKTWKKNSISIINRLMNNFEIEKIAADLNISARAVYKNIQFNYLNEIIDLQNEIIKIIKF